MRFVTFRLKRLYPLFLLFGIGAFTLLCLFVSVPYASHALGQASVSAMTEASVPPVIILDAGHGGEDCGAIGDSGVYEKDLNLSVTLELGRILTEAGYTVVYTRTEDRLLYKEEENIRGMRKIYDLKNRCAVAQAYEDATFVSLHMNSFGDARYSGLQVYYAPANEDSRLLAEAIQSTVCQRLQTDNRRKIKSGTDMYVLEHAGVPAVLVECGFISNREECERLCDATYRTSLAQAIADAIASRRPLGE